MSLSQSAQKLVPALARRHKVPVATYAAALIDSALELEEDRVLSEIGDGRIAENPKKWLTHENVWHRGTLNTTQK